MSRSDDVGETTLILDACSIINLAATNRLPDILAAISLPVVICDTVAGETLYLRHGGHGVDAAGRDPIDVSRWIDAGQLQVISATTDEELESFVDLAVVLDDGEAMTIALALHRSLTVVTDDRKAVRIASQLVPVESSLALVKRWTELDAVDIQTTRIILSNVRDRARYFPHAQHPLRSWWSSIFEDLPLI